MQADSQINPYARALHTYPSGPYLHRLTRQSSTTAPTRALTMTADFAARLRNTRLERKRKRTEVARDAGIALGVHGRYERGERLPTVDTARAIADALGVSLDYLTGDSTAAVQDRRRAGPPPCRTAAVQDCRRAGLPPCRTAACSNASTLSQNYRPTDVTPYSMFWMHSSGMQRRPRLTLNVIALFMSYHHFS